MSNSDLHNGQIGDRGDPITSSFHIQRTVQGLPCIVPSPLRGSGTLGFMSKQPSAEALGLEMSALRASVWARPVESTQMRVHSQNSASGIVWGTRRLVQSSGRWRRGAGGAEGEVDAVGKESGGDQDDAEHQTAESKNLFLVATHNREAEQ